MAYHLRRVSDRAGDSGGMSDFYYDNGEKVIVEHHARPKLNGIIQVGSLYARTMQWQDWWRTSRIIEILEEKEDYVKFKTLNSIYMWWRD